MHLQRKLKVTKGTWKQKQASNDKIQLTVFNEFNSAWYLTMRPMPSFLTASHSCHLQAASLRDDALEDTSHICIKHPPSSPL